ncbi:MAG: bifunctional folylpolyglutamate synthase/dihydrofolate synthase [Dehalococcoidia bacterium]|nr:bifunctional folylpolyglutamate synthase/dihydrofolate synthase [Dehalococcoidia bacterium]
MAFEAYRAAVDYLVEDLWRRFPVVAPARALQDRMRLVLGELGDPHLRFPVVHVGGTTGKGSTSAMVASVLEAAGYRVGLYTSPFLQTFIERISVNGELIAPDRFASLVEAMKPLVRRMHIDATDGEGWGRPTLLEVVFGVAMQHFAEEGVDVAVIEVGVGGRTDCTNVFGPSAVSVLTNVQLDHTEVLGHTPAAIAREKAAIIKPGGFAVSGARGEALKVIAERCRDLAVDLWRLPGEVRLRATNCGPLVVTPRRRLLVAPVLAGNHQHFNAALAVAAADALALRVEGFNVPDEAMAAGIARARIPGRLEVMQERPRVVLDGAHNPAAAAVLGTALEDGAAGHYRRLVLLVGVLEDKDRRRILGQLAPRADHVVVTSAPLRERSGDAGETLSAARRWAGRDVPVELVEPPMDALARALEVAGPDDLVCATGSIYLIGHLRGHWFSEEMLLRERRVRYAAT